MKIFISGSSSGLGLSLVKSFILQGDNVLGIGRRQFELDTKGIDLNPSQKSSGLPALQASPRDECILFSAREGASTFRPKGSTNKFKYIQCDITDPLQVKHTFAEIKMADFSPDIAIFCAGSATDDIVKGEFNPERLKENFSVNLFGVMYWIELFLPHFLKKRSGIFAYISSMSIYRENHKDRIGYSASKLAVNKVFENLRMQYYKQEVRFTVFNMGRISEKKELIGTSYDEAAAKIVKILKSKNIPSEVNIPLFQYLLIRLTMYIPENIYHKFIFK